MKEMLFGVLGALLVALVLWATGQIGNAANQISVPKFSVVAFNQEFCPTGWRAFESGRGRYIVGLNKDGELAKQIGSSLSDKEDRAAGAHTHNYLDATVGGDVGNMTVGNNSSRPDVPRITAENEAPKGTNAPYIQLLLCEKI